MRNEIDVNLVNRLKAMIDFCQKIDVSLKNDSELFIHDKFESIEENNKNKMELINQLSDLVMLIKSSYPNGLMSAIHMQQDSIEKNQLHELMNHLKVEVANCYQHIEINSSLVFANLQFLKDTWEKLIVLNTDSNIYDESGNMVL